MRFILFLISHFLLYFIFPNNLETTFFKHDQEKKNQSQELHDRRKNVVANSFGVFNTATAKHAKRAIIKDVDGNELIDFAGVLGII